MHVLSKQQGLAEEISKQEWENAYAIHNNERIHRYMYDLWPQYANAECAKMSKKTQIR